MRFDEQQIHGFSLRVPTKTIEIDIPLLMDEKVEVVIQGQIEEVTMRVDKKTGELIRRHVLTVDDMEVRAK